MLESVDKSVGNQKIIADIGGTHARFAILNEVGSIHSERVLKVSEHVSFVSAYQAYLKVSGNPEITQAAIAIANPIDDDLIKMTNHHWDFSIEETRKILALESLVFKNDFEALAMSIPFLNQDDSYQVGGFKIKPNKPIGVLGPGTGLGVSGLIHSAGKWVPLSGEGGHVSLSPTNKRESQILEVCWQTYKHVSAERLISGSGLQRIYDAICQLDRLEAQPNITPQEITRNALERTDKCCQETLDVFTALLGVVAGNLALTLGAQGGIYIGGGIIPKLGSYFEKSPFRESFESKGRFKDYLKDIPVFVITSKNPALIGIRQVFE